MKSFAIRLCLSVAFLAASLGAYADIQPGGFPGISGMAKLSDDAYLAVHDVKVKENPDEEGARLSLLTFRPEGDIACTPVNVDWSALKGGRPNDLESICAIAGQPGEYVAVESGYLKKAHGRIIHLKATLDSGEAVVSVLGMVRYLPNLPDGPRFEDIEGAQTFQRDGDTYLLLTKRGKDEKKARLIWGKLDWVRPVFKVAGDYKVETPFAKWDVKGEKRYASDVLIVENEIYISSCNDPGDDGPFSSAVYHVGAIRSTGQLIHLIDSEQSEVARYEGHKVEALAPGHGPRGLWVAATDDENFKGSIFPTSKP